MSSKGRSKIGSSKTLTRNQTRKAQRTGQQADRLREVTRWADEWERRKRNPLEVTEESKKRRRVRKINMNESAITRRSVALSSLTAQLETGTKVLSTKGIVQIPYEIYSKLMEETATPEIILPLSHVDVERIKKEIETLKKRGAIIERQKI